MSEVSVDRSFYSPFADDIAAWQRDYTPGPFTREEFYQFFEDGFVLKRDLLKKELLDSAIQSVERLVDELAQTLYKAVMNFYI